MKTTADRFWDKVDKTNECWMWTASGNGRGYGQFWDGTAKRLKLAHRFSYELAHGPIPVSLQIDHLCRNRLCVRPGHLEAVTCRENLLRGETSTARQAAQTHCLHGHPLCGANLRWHSGKRECITCARARDRRRRPKKS